MEKNPSYRERECYIFLAEGACIRNKVMMASYTFKIQKRILIH